MHHKYTNMEDSKDRRVAQLATQLQKPSIGTYIAFTGMLWSLFSCLVVIYLLPETWRRDMRSAAVAAAALFSGFLVAPLASRLTTKQQRESIVELVEIAEARHVATLVSLYVGPTTSFSSALLRTALIRLLPAMRREDAVRLNSDLWNLLYKHLDWEQPAFILAVLKATENAGSVSLLPEIDKLILHSRVCRRDEQVRQAALSCRNILQDRVRQVNNPYTLLRSAVPFAAPNTLLRPASGAKQPEFEAAKQLLRSSTGGASCASNDHNAFLPDFNLMESQEQPQQQVQLGQRPDEDASR